MKPEELQFFKRFKELYPHYEIVEYKNLSSDILVKDENGFLHKKTSGYKVINFAFGIQSTINKKEFLQYELDKRNIELTLVEYKGMKEKCMLKDKNGFTYSPTMYDVLAGHPVTIRTCVEKEKLFIYKANIKHNFLYYYPDFKYTNGKQKIKIICKIHGEFYQKCESHLFGRGCAKCRNDLNSYDKRLWVKRYESKECSFYVLEFYNDTETFIKVGVTSKALNKRYKSTTDNDYKFKEIMLIKGTSKEVIDFESYFLKHLKEYRYNPKQKFQGRTECFTLQSKTKIYEHFKAN
jgi:hypothetical protein